MIEIESVHQVVRAREGWFKLDLIQSDIRNAMRFIDLIRNVGLADEAIGMEMK